MSYLCNRNRETNNVSRDAQMAESVDALVSNTSGAIHPGSSPGLGTKEAVDTFEYQPLSCFLKV